MKAKLPLFLCCVTLLVNGCMSNIHKRATSRDPGFFETAMRFEPRAHDEAEVKIAEAADSVNDSLKELSEIERAMHPGASLPKPPNPARIGMAGTGSVDWIGPVEPLVEKIAKASHYRLRVLGAKPAIPALVQISKQDVPLMDILRDVTFQVQKKVDIVVYPSNRVIELRYLR
jgi:defect-in-organelle-trafficking protein DotD